MARKHQLREQRSGTVINLTSKQQETTLGIALREVERNIRSNFSIRLHHRKNLLLRDIVSKLRGRFPDVDFHFHFNNTSMRPDGGILSIQDTDNEQYPILIAEVKNQGTNDLRRSEGLPRQAKGNAIERLGKNVVGFRTALIHESITPFVCFGYGCDFEADSSILDRVSTIAMFGPLNEVHVFDKGDDGRFNRGSFFFRDEEWNEDEMVDVMYEIAERSIYYYFSKYGAERFVI